MSAKVNGLGHIGFYVQDLELMKDFYANFIGMTMTKVSQNSAFFSADPEACDHEIALMKGRSSLEDTHFIQQISMRVDSLDDLRDFTRRIAEKEYKLDKIVTHASAIGCYFRDPENNPVEVFWLTGHTSWAQISIPIDIDQSDEKVMAEVDRSFEVAQVVEMGKPQTPETQAAIRELGAAAVASR
ncbi:MAG: VOC family protein [SAR202 cluster bacterium]|nr:VOC family protein [SAR202 cluster bacterium]